MANSVITHERRGGADGYISDGHPSIKKDGAQSAISNFEYTRSAIFYRLRIPESSFARDANSVRPSFSPLTD